MKILRINANPVKPRNEEYPTGQQRNVAGATRKLDRRYRNIARGVNEIIDSIDFRIVETNSITANERIYVYELDMDEFARVNLFLQRLLNDELLDNPQGVFTEQWWLNQNLEKSYESGTRVTLQSAKNVTTVKDAGPELSLQVRSITLEDILFQPGYQRRVGMVKARTFNGMKGLTEQTRADLADTLARGMRDGMGVREVKKNVMDRVGVSESRAERIVRTEINAANNLAKTDETTALNEDIYDDSDVELGVMHWSALSPTTRIDHAERNGWIGSPQKQNIWWDTEAQGGRINCLCSITPVLIDKETGKSFQSELSDTMKKDRAEFKAA